MNNYGDICELLNKNNIKHNVFEFDGIIPFDNEKVVTGTELERIVKTLAYKVGEEKILIAILNGDRLDYKKIANVLQIKRNQLEMLAKDEIEELGFEIGGVCPIIPNKDIKVLLDTRIQIYDYIYCGMSRKDKVLKIFVHDLKKISRGICVDIVKNENN